MSKYEIMIRTKVDNHIEFPVNGLDMSSYVMQVQSGTRQASAGSALYDLAAVIVHHGSGTGSGHYTALATNNQVNMKSCSKLVRIYFAFYHKGGRIL